MDFSMRKSFKSQGSYKHMRRISAGGGSNSSYEELPILVDHELSHQQRVSVDPTGDDRREFVVKIDDGDADSRRNRDVVETVNGDKTLRQSSYQFWRDEFDGGEGGGGGGSREDFRFRRDVEMEDPPSRLIGQFLNKQKVAGEMALDMDMEMDELRRVPRELRVSFEPTGSSESESVRRRYKDSPEKEIEQEKQRQRQHDRGGSVNFGEEVVRCTANSSFKRNPSFQKRSSLLLRVKTKSRLQDPSPEEEDRRSGRILKSDQLKSGMLEKAIEDEEDDPLFGEDLPEEYRKRNFSTLTLLQWISLILIIAALVCSLTIPALKEKNLWNLRLWKWEVLVLVLICGRLVSGWGVRLVVFFIERNFLLRKKVLYFVYGIRKAVQNCLWLGLVLIAWHLLFDEKVARETNSETLKNVTKILICFLVGFILWLLKTLVIKVLASSFHVSTYFDRIQESLFNQYVIETLSGPPLIEIQRTEEEEERTALEVRKLQNAGATIPPDLRAAVFPPAKSGRVGIGSGSLQKSFAARSVKFSRALSKKEDNGITIDHLHKLNTKNVSAWNMKRLMNIVRHGVLSTLDEQIHGSTIHEDESAGQIRSEFEAKAAARKIFQNVARPGSKYIYLEDLMRFMREDEAVKTMSLFEGASETRRISKQSLKNWVVNAFRERRALALTLNDTKTAVNKLRQVVNIIVSIIIAVIGLLILGIATSKFLLFVSSQLVLAAFVFGNTCKTVFESIIFLFVTHPFDVGDRCEVDGVQMIVEEMNILSTIFLRYDNLKIMYPNSVLSSKPISNYYRSPDMGDAVEFSIHVSTPPEKIMLMKQRITSFIENKKEHWYPNPTIILKDFDGLNMVKIAVWLCHRMNHQNMGERWERRALLVEEMGKIFRELDMQYRLLPLDINIRAMPPITSNRMPSTWTSTAR